MNHDRRSRDLRTDDRALADREGVLGDDLALDLTLDPNCTFEGELAGDPTSFPEKRGPSPGFVRLGLLALEHLRLPWRGIAGRGRRLRTQSTRPVAPLTVLAKQRH